LLLLVMGQTIREQLVVLEEQHFLVGLVPTAEQVV
jgi:hypothetical protein